MSNTCLGFSWLGLCQYDPAAPQIYFSLGDAAAVLGVTMLIPQFLKPIYIFRLRCRGLSVFGLYLIVMAAGIATLMAAILLSLPVPRSYLLSYPIAWEVFATILFGCVYFALAYTSVGLARIPGSRVAEFVRLSANFLAEASELDRVEFAKDIARLIGPLARMAQFPEHRWEPTAFDDFIHRRELADGSYAGALLRILSDSAFCRTLVDRCPWVAVHSLNVLAQNRVAPSGARQFVGELARQALVSQESMVGREVHHVGFSAAPLLSEALFGNAFVVQKLEPFRGLLFGDASDVTPELARRFARAATRALRVILDRGDVWQSTDTYQIKEIYSWMCMDLAARKRKGQLDYRVMIELKSGILDAVSACRDKLATMSPDHQARMYGQDHTVFDAVGDIVFDALTSVSNDFVGASDDSWLLVWDVVNRAFPIYGEQQDGFDALQFNIAKKIVAKLNDNMDGWYPALTRVFLTVLGPCSQPGEPDVRSAYGILKHAAYLVWKEKFKSLYLKNVAKAQAYLPKDVSFEPEGDAFIHTFADGQTKRTNLSDVQPASLPLDDPGLRTGHVC